MGPLSVRQVSSALVLDMKPHDDNYCPIASTHEKYNEAIYFICKCLESYHKPDEFRYNINAFIQSFRNITFMLQSEENRPEFFDEWYTQKQEEMKTHELLQRFVSARNIVVKKSMLETRSTVRVGIFRGRKMKLAIQHEISPFTPTLCILGNCKNIMIGLMIDREHSAIGEQLGVEREWIVDSVGDNEVISLCIKGMEYMGRLLADAHALYDIEYKIEDLSVLDIDKTRVLLESDIDPSLPEKWGW